MPRAEIRASLRHKPRFTGPRRMQVMALLLLAAGGDPARADLRPAELTTGNGHHVVVGFHPTEGMERGIPDDSWFARGIALDRQRRWEESYEAFIKARNEFAELLRRKPRWEGIIRGWKLKAEFQMEQSKALKYSLHSRWYYSRFQSSKKAMVLHNKWLGIRAFTGQADYRMAQEIINEYRNSLRRNPRDDAARLALAGLYHEIGKSALGHVEFAQVLRSASPQYALQAAYYFTAAGNRDQAFRYLERAVKMYSANRRHALMANDFDPLRSDPRFKRLVGEP